MRGTAPTTALIALLATLVAIASSATAAPTTTSGPTPGAHLAHFDLLNKPTTFEKIPRILRFPFEHGLQKGARHGFRTGTVRLPEGTVTAVGNRRMICFETKVGESGAGSCDHTRRILHKGLSVYSPCVEGTEDVRISGLVPNGITALGIDRHADGQIEGTIPVTDNAYIAVVEPVGVVLHAIGPGAHGLVIEFPLGRLGSEKELCGATHYGGVAADDAPQTSSVAKPHPSRQDTGPERVADDLLAARGDMGACRPAAARHAFAAFLDAFDHGNLRTLDSLFAREPAFRWFSAGSPGPPRFDRAASRRDTLIPYLRALHRRHYRLGLAWLRVNEGSPHSTGLAFELRGSMQGFRNRRWFPLAGKANLFCPADGPKFRVLSLGLPGAARPRPVGLSLSRF